MSWSPAMNENRRNRRRQGDLFDDPVLSFKLVCDGNEPLTNRFVVARAAHECWVCARPIARGERIRVETRRSADGKRLDDRRVCAACCEVIAEMQATRDADAINARWDAGRQGRRG